MRFASRHLLITFRPDLDFRLAFPLFSSLGLPLPERKPPLLSVVYNMRLAEGALRLRLRSPSRAADLACSTAAVRAHQQCDLSSECYLPKLYSISMSLTNHCISTA